MSGTSAIDAIGAGLIGVPPVRAVLGDGRRRHFQHGPIDLVIEAFGSSGEVACAYEQAWTRFQSILGELAGELPRLRAPVTDAGAALSGTVARRMVRAAAPHRSVFVTPMAAVAGAVADEVLVALVAGRALGKAYVNNGGDIALFLAPGATFRTGIVTLGAVPSLDGLTEIGAESDVRGLATSGWRGRSLSLGIADSVTALAASAAQADAAATLIANAVDAADPSIRRQPASSLDPDNDLGERLVTVEVGRLAPSMVDHALGRGAEVAEAMRTAGLIAGALLSLGDKSRSVVYPAGLRASSLAV
ncbi:MAG: UPF0280 family protein [Rhodospirillales bacterium]|nr:UPF0280 family protein [Rhodospirillales bacterium]